MLTTNAFLAKLDSKGTSLVYSAVFGGFGLDIGYGVAVDPAGEAFVVGTTSSTNFPTLNTSGLLAATNSGGSDVFVTAFNTNGTALLYSVYLGGANNDFGYGIAVDQLDTPTLSVRRSRQIWLRPARFKPITPAARTGTRSSPKYLTIRQPSSCQPVARTFRWR